MPESPPYWSGRFSNGPVWADRVRDAFRDADLPTGNHAWGGANVRSAAASTSPTSRCRRRATAALDDDRRRRPAAGGDLDRRQRRPRPRRQQRRSRRRRATRPSGSATSRRPRRSGARDFLILYASRHRRDPEVRRRPRRRPFRDPRHQGLQPRARRPDRGAARRRRPGRKCRTSTALFNDLLDAPEALRRAQHDDPLPRRGRQSRAAAGRALRRAFFDEIHPNRVVHRHIAEAAMARIDRRRADGRGDRPPRPPRCRCRRPSRCSSPRCSVSSGSGLPAQDPRPERRRRAG